jgi:hypothetical protein
MLIKRNVLSFFSLRNIKLFLNSSRALCTSKYNFSDKELKKYLEQGSRSRSLKLTFVKFYCNFEIKNLNNIPYVVSFSIVGHKIYFIKSLQLRRVKDIKQESLKLVVAFLEACFKLSKDVRKVSFQKILFLFHDPKQPEINFLSQAVLERKDFIAQTFIQKKKQLYELVVKNTITGKKITFHNTSLLLRFRLDEIQVHFCKKFKDILLNSTNTNISDISIFGKPNKISIKLMQSIEFSGLLNSLVLKEGFENYLLTFIRLLKLNPLIALAAPSLSKLIFSSFFYKVSKTPISKCFLEDSTTKLLERAYKQAVPEVYVPHMKEGFHYDVNGLYPFVMKEFDFPIGLPCELSELEINNFNFDETFFGFLEVEVYCPSTILKPILVTTRKGSEELLCPVGRWVDVYFSEELKYALSLGYTFKVLRGLSYRKSKIFTDFVNTLHTIRVKYARNSPFNKIIKELMNTISGRFAMKSSSSTSLRWLTFAEYKNLLLTNLTNNIIDVNNNMLLASVTCSTTKQEYSFVHIAAAITSYGRVVMHKYKCDPNNIIYYSDTDAIFCKYEFNQALISPYKLGLLKECGKVTEAFFLSSTKYAYSYTDNSTKFVGILEKVNFFDEFKKTRNQRLFFLSNLLTIDLLRERQRLFSKGVWVATKPYDLFSLILKKQEIKSLLVYPIKNNALILYIKEKIKKIIFDFFK